MNADFDHLWLRDDLVLVGDRRTTGSGDSVACHYAGTGERTRDLHLGSAHDLDQAVARAREALPQWRALPAAARRDLLLRAAALLVARTDRLAAVAAVDTGLTIENVRGFVRHAAGWLSYYAGWIDKAGGAVVPTDPDSLDYVRHEPYGVVGVISPSNSSVSGMVLAPLLAAGNCAVMKPSHHTAQVTAEFLQVFVEAGLPPGVVNCVPGGAELGEALVRHPGIDKVHFTGSCTVGARVGSLAATHLKPTGMELGGKSATIVFPDADVDVAADLAMRALVRQTGQSCVAGTRIIVHESVADEVLQRTIERTRALKLGLPLEADTEIGPVVSQAACTRIMAVIEQARRERMGRLAMGGQRGGGALAGGYFIEPTIFADVDNACPLAQEETFGPVISFMRFRSDDEAIAMANATRYGLAAYVVTRDLRRAHRSAAELDVGTLWINGAAGVIPGGPFGGVKHSGHGRVGGLEGLHEFTRPKNVWIRL